jgi:hypothetical protein
MLAQLPVAADTNAKPSPLYSVLNLEKSHTFYKKPNMPSPFCLRDIQPHTASGQTVTLIFSFFRDKINLRYKQFIPYREHSMFPLDRPTG